MLRILGSYRLAGETFAVVGALVGLRAVLWWAGIEGMGTTALASSIIAGGIFVMGLVVAGTLADYRDAERAPTQVAASLHTILRECETFHQAYGRPGLEDVRDRLICVVTTLRADIERGDSRTCQAAIEELSISFLELENSDVPANYIVRLRAEQSALCQSVLRIYHIQREEFLPSAKAMFNSLVLVIVTMLMFTDMGGLVETLVTVGFLVFFFVYLMRLLNVIDQPFKVGQARTADDVSLFLLTEFVVRARTLDIRSDVSAQEVAGLADAVEDQLVWTEESAPEGTSAGEMSADLGEVIEEAVHDSLDRAPERSVDGA